MELDFGPAGVRVDRVRIKHHVINTPVDLSLTIRDINHNKIFSAVMDNVTEATIVSEFQLG